MNSILNIAAYQFVPLPVAELPDWRAAFKDRAIGYALKGTILLSHEGINLCLAGAPEYVAEFQNFLHGYPQFRQLTYRRSWSEQQPFKRLLVRLKKEVISMGQPDIQPGQRPAPYIEPHTLRQWYEQGRPMLMLDTRNRYEVEQGTFFNAIDLGLKNFRSFPAAIACLPPQAKQMPVVTFCTGGVRCEKAALWLQKQGYSEVYQLQGGILNYFSQCGSAYFQGKCFVFDERMLLDEYDMER